MDVLFFATVLAGAVAAFCYGYRSQLNARDRDQDDAWTRYRRDMRDRSDLDRDSMEPRS